MCADLSYQAIAFDWENRALRRNVSCEMTGMGLAVSNSASGSEVPATAWTELLAPAVGTFCRS